MTRICARAFLSLNDPGERILDRIESPNEQSGTPSVSEKLVEVVVGGKKVLAANRSKVVVWCGSFSEGVKSCPPVHSPVLATEYW